MWIYWCVLPYCSGDFKRRLPRTPSTGTMSSADDLDEREPPSPSDNGKSGWTNFISYHTIYTIICILSFSQALNFIFFLISLTLCLYAFKVFSFFFFLFTSIYINLVKFILLVGSVKFCLVLIDCILWKYLLYILLSVWKSSYFSVRLKCDNELMPFLSYCSLSILQF